MYPYLFELGPFEILGHELGPFRLHSFGLMLAIAFLVCGELYARELKRRHLDPELAGTVLTWAIVGGLVGARLYYLIEFWDSVRQDLLGAVFSGAGLVAYGGFLGGVAACWIALRRRGAPVLVASDAAAPLLALGQGIGRIGCLLAGDGDYGPPSDLPWAMAFPHGIVPTPIERTLSASGQLVEVPVTVHPTPLYESIALIVVFSILWRLRRRPWPTGRLFATYLVLQGIERFLAEFVRTNPVWFAGLSGAQVWAAASVVIGVIWLVRLRSAQAPSAA